MKLAFRKLALFCIKTITKLLSFVRCKGAEAQRHKEWTILNLIFGILNRIMFRSAISPAPARSAETSGLI